MSKFAYDADFYGWADEQAQLLRAGKLSKADNASIAGEIESMGRSEMREFAGRLAEVLTHLLKWRSQQAGRGSSWRASIVVQRSRLAEHLTDCPSRKPKAPEAVARAFNEARVIAGDETKLGEPACPWSPEQILNPGFWPE